MQTIIGAGGAIGQDLAKELASFTPHIRLVSRNPKKVNETDELFPADVTNAAQLSKAIEGSEIVYCVVGFEYKLKVWRNTWPAFTKNLLDACKTHGAKLVFFDNVYSYDIQAIPHMTEESLINPPSKKGEVRAQLLQRLQQTMDSGEVSVLIARAADFYGPGINNSVLQETVLKNFQKGKAANWFADDTKVHSFTYTPDAAKATALLGNTPDAFNQTWHLPTCADRLTGKEWVELFAREMGVEPKYTVLKKWIIGLLGIFIPIMKEMHEMLYQNDRDYFFDSSKFTHRFGEMATPYEEGVKAVLKG
ncbi:MAG: NAD-dependent epimerase/dehydratase family protein [Saprospirales bacterium]|nr:NAD-dependent epimerase/dehydratase family protein [Saprospirales bacterium]MBK8492253.1 NAD-dependent epimerase/dehydratase family protein [Saprospirales bacterium]